MAAEFCTWTHEDSPVAIPEGIRVRWEHDEHHETRGSYGYETEEETRAAEDQEIEKLESGEWVVLWYVLETDDGEHLDSCGGIVIGNSESELVKWFEHSIKSQIPSEIELANAQLGEAIHFVGRAQSALLRASLRLNAAHEKELERVRSAWGKHWEETHAEKPGCDC